MRQADNALATCEPLALARRLDACGDDLALYAFSSLKREKVFFDICKYFDEPFCALVDARIRIGATRRCAMRQQNCRGAPMRENSFC